MTSCWLTQAGLTRFNELLIIKPSHKGGRSTYWGDGGDLREDMIKRYCVYVWKWPNIKNLLRKKELQDQEQKIADSRELQTAESKVLQYTSKKLKT